MAAGIYIISGFLGAGKTTLIRKLLKESLSKEKVVLIENDFGEISVDAALLKAGGVEVREMNSGCICCSLSGDFAKALKEVAERFNPDVIIIEPSGVGKLSEVLTACKNPSIASLVEVRASITVADAKRCHMYYENFGEFFENQIENADVVILSQVENAPAKLTAACGLVNKLNPRATLFGSSWDSINADEILLRRQAHQSNKGCHCNDHECKNDHDHHDCNCNHHHDHNKCSHEHHTADAFDTVTIRLKRSYSAKELKACMNKAKESTSGSILRAKGVVKGLEGHLNMQYIPGNLIISPCAAEGNSICFIGRKLNAEAISASFDRR